MSLIYAEIVFIASLKIIDHIFTYFSNRKTEKTWFKSANCTRL